MAKFETTGQIVALFLGAAAVGILLIVLLNAEVHKREEDKVQGQSEPNQKGPGFFERIENNLKTFFGGESRLMEEDNGGAKRRKKRQAEQYSGGGEDKKESGRVKGVLETDSQKLSIMDTSRNQQQERPATGGDKAGKDGEDFQEALLEEAIAKHKDQFISSCKHRFCRPPECPKPVACPVTNCSSIQGNRNSRPDDASLDAEGGNASGRRNTSHKTAHNFPLLDDGYTHDSHVAGQPFVCDFVGEIIITVFITSLINFSIIGFIMACYRARKADTYWEEEDDERQLVYQDLPSRRSSFSEFGSHQLDRSPSLSILKNPGYII